MGYNLRSKTKKGNCNDLTSKNSMSQFLIIIWILLDPVNYSPYTLKGSKIKQKLKLEDLIIESSTISKRNNETKQGYMLHAPLNGKFFVDVGVFWKSKKGKAVPDEGVNSGEDAFVVVWDRSNLILAVADGVSGANTVSIK